MRMSVVVKGMKLPDMCGHCRFATAFDCKATGNFIIDHSVRNADCPLDEVPEPHGDLIDREGLQDIIGQLNLNWEYGQGVSDCWDALLDAPAIIPASEEVET